MSQKNSDHHPLKFVAGADAFGCALKDTLVSHLRSLNIPVEDLGTDNHYSIGAKIGQIVSSGTEIRGLLACGTGVGVSIFANKFPGVYAATCLTQPTPSTPGQSTTLTSSPFPASPPPLTPPSKP
ncbi:putative ribose-5-phosphate isomerase [Helianthus debilis subsp. tardiflorus]